jgi:general secretion pathway protein D
MKTLLDQFGNFPLYDPASGPQKADTVRIDLLEKWDQELFTDLRATAPYEGTAVSVADWLVVTAGFDLLREVQDFVNIFAAGVPQIEIEAKIVEVTINDSLDLGVKPIDATTPIFGFPDHTFLKSFTYTLPNQSSGSNSLLTLGGVTDGMAFNIALQALSTYENVSIISRPKIAVREGGRAEIVNTLKLPNYSVSGINAAGQAQAALLYEEVGIKLFVVPRVVGTQTVALNIDIEASAQSGSSISFVLQNGQSISNPIVSRRAAKTVVYLEPGQAVILGGLISERLVDSENRIPVLGEIPILGYLFKSTFKRKEQTNVLFFIRPRILQGSDLNREFGD